MVFTGLNFKLLFLIYSNNAERPLFLNAVGSDNGGGAPKIGGGGGGGGNKNVGSEFNFSSSCYYSSI